MKDSLDYKKDPSENKINIKEKSIPNNIDIYTDPKKVPKSQKDVFIIKLQNTLRLLNLRIAEIESIYKKEIQNLYNQIQKLIFDPTLCLSSGNIISFSELSYEQLEYLEKLALYNKSRLK